MDKIYANLKLLCAKCIYNATELFSITNDTNVHLATSLFILHTIYKTHNIQSFESFSIWWPCGGRVAVPFTGNVLAALRRRKFILKQHKFGVLLIRKHCLRPCGLFQLFLNPSLTIIVYICFLQRPRLKTCDLFVSCFECRETIICFSSKVYKVSNRYKIYKIYKLRIMEN